MKCITTPKNIWEIGGALEKIDISHYVPIFSPIPP